MTDTPIEGEKKITIYTDGASRGNPGPGGWAASMQFPNGKVVEIGGAEGHTTNNRMELTGILKALEYAKEHLGTPGKSTEVKTIEINTDSAYALNGATKWIYGWFKNNWQTAEGQPVANQDIWEAIHQLTWYFKSKCELEFKKVSGHSGVLGNERADLIATAFADGERILLYAGGTRDYERLLGESVGERKPETKKTEDQKLRSKTPAYSYVSMIGGLIEIHDEWKDCEARVKGKSGAKFKKALSSDDEANIILSWTTGKTTETEEENEE
jgi:ribonuclease HI